MTELAPRLGGGFRGRLLLGGDVLGLDDQTGARLGHLHYPAV